MPGQPGVIRYCEWCGDELPSQARRDAMFCSRRHKNAHSKARKKREQEGMISPRSETVDGYTDSEGRSWLPDAGGYTKAGTPETAGSPDAEPLTASQRMASTRFSRLLKGTKAEEAERPIVSPSELELQHRNQGVVLDSIRERELDRLELIRDRQAIARADAQGWSPQDRLHGDPAKQRGQFAARATASRATNRRHDQPRPTQPTYADISEWQSVPTQETDPRRTAGRRLPARYLNT